MSTSTTVQIRIDPSIKAKAQKILKGLGLDLSSAVKAFLVQVVSRKAMPVELLTANGFTPAQEKMLLKEIALTKRYGKRYSSFEEWKNDTM